MGLDMFLFKSAKIHESDPTATINSVMDAMEEVGYWRKANQIHGWFVENVQGGVDDCGYYKVSKQDVEDLLSLCNQVLNIFEKATPELGKVMIGSQLIDGVWEPIYKSGTVYKNLDVETIKELLPPVDGFFFGKTEIDETYKEKIEDTVNILTNILDNFDFENNYLLYSASW